MKHLSPLFFATTFLLSTSMSFAAAGWKNEETIHTASLNSHNLSPQDGNCSDFKSENIVTCVYHDWNNSTKKLDIYEIQSYEDMYDGVTAGAYPWDSSTITNVTNASLDQYGPAIYYDNVEDKQYLVYSKNRSGGPTGNKLVFRKRSSSGDSWGSEVVIHDTVDHSYWIPSILVLHNAGNTVGNVGDILVFYTKDGPEETGQDVCSGRAMVAVSTNGGTSWSNHEISSKKNAEFVHGVQASNGDIFTVFSRYVDWDHLPNGTCSDGYDSGTTTTPQSYVWGMWGKDDRTSWTDWETPTSLLTDTVNSHLHPSISIETRDPASSCSTCQWDLLYIYTVSGKRKVHLRKSTNEGSSWGSAQVLSQTGSESTSPFNIDPHMTIGCRGPIYTYNDAYGEDDKMFARRYDWDYCE